VTETLTVPSLNHRQDVREAVPRSIDHDGARFTLEPLLKDKQIGKRIVPIIPDEARTFGMEGLFKQCGIYASQGQLYEPVDAAQVMYYKEARDGQILEEGINEAGAMSSFIAAGTAYANLGLPMIPFYIYYSMFGFQRVGDLIWLAADSRTKGFLVGARQDVPRSTVKDCSTRTGTVS
jgi:pyruvate dehydrogenase E1 component